MGWNGHGADTSVREAWGKDGTVSKRDGMVIFHRRDTAAG